MNRDRRAGFGGWQRASIRVLRGVGVAAAGLDKDRQTVRRRDAQDAYRSMSGRRRDGLLRIVLPAVVVASRQARRDALLIIEDLPPTPAGLLCSNICLQRMQRDDLLFGPR